MSSPAASDSGDHIDQVVSESTTLLAELHPSEIRREIQKRGIKLKGKRITVRAISGFSFTKNGLPWKPRPGTVDHGDMVDVVLRGFVASLSCIESRPIVASGYWDIEEYEVERYLMELRPQNLYASVNKLFRNGDWGMWSDTEQYSYALTSPASAYSAIWAQTLKLDWRSDCRVVPMFRDLCSSEGLPRWWPAKDRKRFMEFQGLIRHEEQELRREAEGSNNRRSRRKGKAREEETVVDDSSGASEPETSKKPNTSQRARASSRNQPTKADKGKGKGKAPPENVDDGVDNSGAPSNKGKTPNHAGTRQAPDASGGEGNSSEQDLPVSLNRTEPSTSTPAPSTSGTASRGRQSMVTGEQTQTGGEESEHSASADVSSVAKTSQVSPPQLEPRATSAPASPAPATTSIRGPPPERQAVQPALTDNGEPGLARSATQVFDHTSAYVPGSGVAPEQRSLVQETRDFEEPNFTASLGSNGADQVPQETAENARQHGVFGPTSQSNEELALETQSLVDQLIALHGPEIMEGILMQEEDTAQSSQISDTAPPCPPDAVSHSVGPTTQPASNVATNSHTGTFAPESLPGSATPPPRSSINSATGSQPGPSAVSTRPITNPSTPSKRQLEDPTDSGRVGAPPVPSTSHVSEADPHSDFISDMLPELSYDRFEETFLAPDHEFELEYPRVGETVVVYEGRYVFRVSSLNGKYGRELYVDSGTPWNGWNSSGAVVVAKQFLALDMKDLAVIGALVSPELLSLYAIGVMVPEPSRGPLQKRLVSRIAILARDGHLPGPLFSAWMEIQLKLNSWMDEMHRAPCHVPFQSPALSQLVLDAQFEHFNPPPRNP